MTTVQSWLTRGSDQSQLYTAQTPITMAAYDGNATSMPVNVNTATRYQTMDGFGAALTDASASVIWGMPTAARSALMTELFDPVNGHGFSALRLPMGACDFATANYTYDDLSGGVSSTTGNLLPAEQYADTTVGLSGYGSFTSSGTQPTLAVDTTSPFTGTTQAVKVTGTATTFTGIYQTGASYAPVTAGTSFTALTMQRCPAGSAATVGQVKINWYDSTRTQLSGASGGVDGPLVTLTAGGGWTTVAVTSTAPAGASYASINCESSSNTTTRALGSGDSYSFTALGIFAGTVSTWSPVKASSGGGATDTTLTHFSIAHDLTNTVPLLKAALALNPNLKIFAAPWSPPDWMKTGSNNLAGGSLNPAYYGVYAQYFVKFVQAYAAQGIPIYAVTPQNEPENGASGYPCMTMTAAQQATFIGGSLGPAFAAAGITTKIICYDHNWSDTSYPETVLGDSTAGPYVAGTAWHAYAGTVDAQTTVHNAYPGKDAWFTEITASQPGNFAGDLQWHMRNIVLGAPQNWAKGTMHWNLALNENNGPLNGGYTSGQPLVGVHSGTGALTRYSVYYAVTHAAAAVKPGAMRVQATTYGTGLVNTIAYLNPDGSRVLIAECDAQSAQTFKVVESGQQFTATLQPADVQTFVWGGSTSGGSTGPTPVVTTITSASGPGSPIRVTGLPAGSWVFQVAASNSAGIGPMSPGSAPVTITQGG